MKYYYNKPTFKIDMLYILHVLVNISYFTFNGYLKKCLGIRKCKALGEVIRESASWPLRRWHTPLSKRQKQLVIKNASFYCLNCYRCHREDGTSSTIHLVFSVYRPSTKRTPKGDPLLVYIKTPLAYPLDLLLRNLVIGMLVAVTIVALLRFSYALNTFNGNNLLLRNLGGIEKY